MIPAWNPPSLSIIGSGERFPVRRILCVGRNYADHAREMGNDPNAEPPIFFWKPADCLVPHGGDVRYPTLTGDYQPEVELVVALGQGPSVFGYAVGLDMTRRDLQAAARKAGQPWDMAKGFDESAPCGALLTGFSPGERAITLSVNGQTRQSARLSDMTWPVARLIVEAGKRVTLLPGDIIFTGTPAGVAPVVRGDRLEARIEGLPGLDVVIV